MACNLPLIILFPLFICCLYLSTMEVKRFKILLTCFFLFNLFNTSAQYSSTPHFDPSKPTNVYDRLSNNLEYNFLRNGSRTYGYRANLVLVSHNQRNSVHIEIPLLYSTFSQKFGLSDIRFRYYWIPYKDYSKKPRSIWTPSGFIHAYRQLKRWTWQRKMDFRTRIINCIRFWKILNFPYYFIFAQ